MRHLKKRILQDRREKTLLIGSSALSGRIGRSSQRRCAVLQKLQIFPEDVAALSIVKHIAREQHLFFDHIHQRGIVRDQPDVYKRQGLCGSAKKMGALSCSSNSRNSANSDPLSRDRLFIGLSFSASTIAFLVSLACLE